MNAELMDIELLAAPTAEPGFPWVWIGVLLMALVVLWLVWRAWQSPGLVLWRWQRQAAACQTDADCRQLALQIYAWLESKPTVLPTELDARLKQACFANDPLHKPLLQSLIQDIKAAL
jgi:hypothetical protein